MEIQQKIYDALQVGNIENHREFAEQNKLSVEEVTTALTSLNTREIVQLEKKVFQHTELTEEGEAYLAEGTPEAALYAAIKEAADAGRRFSQDEIVAGSKMSFGRAPLMKGKNIVTETETVEVDGKTKKLVFITPSSTPFVDELAQALAQFKKDHIVSPILKQRKCTMLVNTNYFTVSKGEKYYEGLSTLPGDFTREMLDAYISGDQKLPELKPYNWNANGKPVEAGHFHPLMEMRSDMRRMFVELGFEEMDTRKWIESSFWNFDSLFQPQNHPARDAHDTFFMKDAAAEVETFPAEYLERVKETHETGYNNSWSVEEASKNILRTHTTAVTARYLYKLAEEYKEACAESEKKGEPKPEFPIKKYFSIDRVFRNETQDATHLAEFHQVEGCIIGKGLTMGHLMTTIKSFFAKIGMTDIWFKPTFNPYTEPSSEIFAYHPQLGCEIEIGNSGMFRPEMLSTMGLPDDVTTIAWGLSLERPTMIKYSIPNIRDLIGFKQDIYSIRNFGNKK